MKSFQQVLNEVFIAQKSWKIQLMQQWPVIVGHLKSRIFLEKITDDATLIVGVHDIHWMQELYYVSHELLTTINEALGKTWVKHIKFVISSQFRIKKPYRRKPQERIVSAKKKVVKRTPLHEKQLCALRGIQDLELQKTLADLFEMSV